LAHERYDPFGAVASVAKGRAHCHLDGSVRPATLLELGREYKKPMPRDDADALTDFMRVDDAKSLEDYLARFDVTLGVMQTSEALERIAYELSIDAARDGVRYIEVRYAPVLNTREGLSLEHAVEAPLRGLARAERDGGAMARVIVTGTASPDARHHDAVGATGGVVQRSGRGRLRSRRWRARQSSRAARRGVRVRARERSRLHLPCGRGADASSVREAVHLCGAHRIGHATRLIEDESLTQYVNDRRIALEICLTSNVQTHAG
jgi:adenosine deaminase